MKRKSDKPLSKHTLNLYAGQIDKLQELHPRIGAGHAIRLLIDKHIATCEEEAAKVIPEPKPEFDVEELS